MIFTNAFLRRPVCILVPLLVAACTSDDTVVAPPNENLDRVWSVESNVRAINMARGDEFQIILTPRDINGNVLPLEGEVRHTSEHPDVVDVDSTGKLRAVDVTGGIRIFSSLTSEGITFTDTINVAVLANTIDVESVEITNGSGGTLNPIINYGSYAFYTVTVKDSDGLSLNGFVHSLRSLDNNVLQVFPPWDLYGRNAGRTKIIAQINAFGRIFADTVEVSVFFRNALSLTINSSLENTFIIATGGTVTFSNYWFPRRDVRVVLNDSRVSPAPVPDTIVVPSYSSVERTFPVPGVYSIAVADTSIKGSIIVRENPTF